MFTDPDRWLEALCAIPGALVYGTFQLYGVLMRGSLGTQADYIKCALNVACAIVVGVLTAYFLARGLSVLIPFKSLQEPSVMGFAIGSVGWELLPLVLAMARNILRKKGRDL